MSLQICSLFSGKRTSNRETRKATDRSGGLIPHHSPFQFFSFGKPHYKEGSYVIADFICMCVGAASVHFMP